MSSLAKTVKNVAGNLLLLQYWCNEYWCNELCYTDATLAADYSDTADAADAAK